MPSPSNGDLALKMSELIDSWDTYTSQLRDWLAGTATGGPYGDGRYPLTNSLGVTFYVPCPAAEAARVDGVVGSAQVFAGDAEGSATAAAGSASAAATARDLALGYRDAAQAARDLALLYRDDAANSASQALTYRNTAVSSSTSAAADAAAAASSAEAAALDAAAADAARIAAEAASAAAATFDPSNFYTKTAADARYAALSHTHAIANVTGLQAALDAKQATIGYTPVNRAGDTMTGGLTAPVFTAAQGSPGTQQILGTWKYATGPDRVYHTIEASGAYGLYLRNSSGSPVGDYQKFEITLDAKRVYFDSNGLGTLGNIYGRDLVASRGDGTGVIFLNGAQSRFLFFDGTNYLLPTSDLYIRGGLAWHSANFNPASKQDALGYTPMMRDSQTITDWNNTLTNGIYMASGAANNPTGNSAWYIGRVTVHNTDWITQEVWDFTAAEHATNVWRRQKNSGVWGAWTRDQYIAGHRLRNDSGFLLSDSAMRRVGANQRLPADAGSWVNEPRVFVQSGDPGAAAADGDLWAW